VKVKVIANAHAAGGGEFSSAYLMKLLLDYGCEVEFHPTKGVVATYPLPKGVKLLNSFTQNPKGECDVLVLYSNDFVYRLDPHQGIWTRLLKEAKRKVVVLNFTIGHSWHPWFANEIDRFLFLNTTKQKEFLDKVPGKDTMVLAPPVDTGFFLEIEPDYRRLNFIRHSRFNGKYDEKETLFLIKAFLEISPTSQFWFMATPPFLRHHYGRDPRFHLLSWDEMPVPVFLRRGSLFWYRLPKEMKDQGPRVVVEAMASGIPVIADDRDGARDRVGEGGWLCNSTSEYIETVRSIVGNLESLRLRGQHARRRALIEFDPNKWVKAIIS
jgi:glycosyltransferase involved in cell wall biosynthesis